MIESENKQLVVNEKQKLTETEREYAFESGVEQVMQRIGVLLSQKDYVVVEIDGSGINVGKTKLNQELALKCHQHKIPHVSVSKPYLFHAGLISTLSLLQQWFNSKKGVIVFDAAHSFAFDTEEVRRTARNGDDSVVKEIGQKFNLGIEKVDIMVAIYSPQRPFSSTPVGDIIIKNEYVKEK